MIFLLSACATRHQVPEEYVEKVKERSSVQSSQRTHVLFLVDGLTLKILEQQFQKNRLPNLKNYFLSNGGRIHRAHAVFPTLTYTNISGLLHEKPVHQTGALGNKFLYNNKLIDFEAIDDRDDFSRLMHGQNIFSRLAEKSYFTVSLDYGLGVDATISSSLWDIRSGYSASQLDFRFLDQKKIDSLKSLLSDNNPEHWPDFIFIHLIGNDFLSHRYGPKSVEALTYLTALDRDLGEVFNMLKRAEKNHQVISLLTADHGFDLKNKRFTQIENVVRKINPGIRVINESRFAALYFVQNPKEQQLLDTAKNLMANKNIEIVVYKYGARVQIITKSLQMYFDEVANVNCNPGMIAIAVNGFAATCTDQLPTEIKNKIYPFFISNLASYFKAEKAPDMVAIPNPETSFSSRGLGFHGGPTADETIVPLLIRNANFPDLNAIPALWQLLQFVN